MSLNTADTRYLARVLNARQILARCLNLADISWQVLHSGVRGLIAHVESIYGMYYSNFGQVMKITVVT
jgi:hypothetical protein